MRSEKIPQSVIGPIIGPINRLTIGQQRENCQKSRSNTTRVAQVAERVVASVSRRPIKLFGIKN